MKKLVDLKPDDVVYIYTITTFPDKEVLTKSKSKVYKVVKHYYNASVYDNFESSENPVRRILKMNEGVVYRNSVWLAEDDDKLAESILSSYMKRKIEIFEHDIKLYQNRLTLIDEFFKEEQ